MTIHIKEACKQLYDDLALICFKKICKCCTQLEESKDLLLFALEVQKIVRAYNNLHQKIDEACKDHTQES